VAPVPEEKPAEHTLLPDVGQMHAQAASNESKHCRFSVSHGQARVGSVARSNPGTQSSSGWVGSEPGEPGLGCDELVPLGAGVAGPGD
jgi:hypothetical protein